MSDHPFKNPLHQLLFEMGVLDKLPEWVKWVAMDKYGDWYGFSDKPVKITTPICWKGENSGELTLPMPTQDQIKALGLEWEETCIQVR